MINSASGLAKGIEMPKTDGEAEHFLCSATSMMYVKPSFCHGIKESGEKP